MRTPLLALVLVLSSASCTAVKPLNIIGDQCDLSSECAEPLVCGLGRCRRQCEALRDCPLGLKCIKLQEPVGLSVCQLPEEKSCTNNSDCPAPLTCFGLAGCLLPCSVDTDCVPGATCSDAGECIEPEIALCVYDSDCDYPAVCSETQQQCAFECEEDFHCGATGGGCVQHESCAEGPCMCRPSCTVGEGGCPRGTDCVPCGDGLECGTATAYCERPNPDGIDGGV